MSNILIKTVRINGFRGLKNIEVELEQTTVLTGMNNAGKTSFLKALQIVFGNRHFITQDDFFIENGTSVDKIIIDILIVPIIDGVEVDNFSEEWETLFGTSRIKYNEDKPFIPLRTIITFDLIGTFYTTQQYILDSWSDFENGDEHWYDIDNGNEKSFRFEEIPFFYMDAQRDILDDLKSKSSYLGKMLSKIEYSPEALIDIEEQIRALNETAVSDSSILSDIRETLKDLDSTIGSHSENIEITPFTKKVRDLNKGLTIYYGNEQDSFPMEHHGMGTRSWSSLLTLKAFIKLLESNSNDNPFFPILAIEEPESHLHPNAQKKLYSQISSMSGQKIISTHSPYIAGASEISEIRNFYKNEIVECGKIDIENFTPETQRQIERQVIKSRGEIFFSKCLVLFEGDTEEQALPILCEKYFGKTSVELGIDFVGVSGNTAYLPFIRFLENLNIPWVILSDNDQNGRIKASVQKQLRQNGTEDKEEDYVFFLNENCDFEQQLIEDGFIHEIKKAFLSLKFYNSEAHRQAQEEQDITEIYNYSDEELLAKMRKEKTKIAPAIAFQIFDSDKELPPKIISLFEKISIILNMDEVTT
jgi:putative ATP-dependent endonuclease of OLD family